MDAAPPVSAESCPVSVKVIASDCGRFIVVQHGDNDNRYGAIFPETYAKELAQLKTGDYIKGRGRFSHDLGGITLDDCELD